MNFYTNVAQWGNQILVREYKNGERVNRKVKYSPTLYVPVQKPTEWKTLDGKNATPYKFDTIKEAKAFIEQYKQQNQWASLKLNANRLSKKPKNNLITL